MAKEYSRTQRVADYLQRELAALIRDEISDPRLGMVSVSAVEVSRDLTHARVFVTPFAGQGDAEAMLQALRHAAGFLRHELRHDLRLRVTPELDFRLDESIERGARVSALISEAVASDERHHQTDPDEE